MNIFAVRWPATTNDGCMPCVFQQPHSRRGVAVKPNLGRSFSVDGMEETYTAVFTNVYWVMFVFPAPQMKPLSVELKRKNRPPLYALWDFFPHSV